MVLATQEQKNKLASLLKMQETNGSFAMTPALCKLMGLDPAIVEKGKTLTRISHLNASFPINTHCQLLQQVGVILTIGKLFHVISARSMNSFDNKGWATALAMEYIEKKLTPLKEEWQKPYDKAKLFVFKVWADSQPALKEAAIHMFTPAGGKKD